MSSRLRQRKVPAGLTYRQGRVDAPSLQPPHRARGVWPEPMHARQVSDVALPLATRYYVRTACRHAVTVASNQLWVHTVVVRSGTLLQPLWCG